jgi:hypothetical protein
MGTTLPTFAGYPEEDPREFIDAIEGIAALRDLSTQRRINVFKAQLREPAKGIFTRTANDVDTDLGDVMENARSAEEQYEAMQHWIIEKYAGNETRHKAQESIMGMKMNLGESPRAFFTRIQKRMHAAGFNAVN